MFEVADTNNKHIHSTSMAPIAGTITGDGANIDTTTTAAAATASPKEEF